MPLPGMPIETGFFTVTQKPIEEAFLNDGVAWTDTAEVLANVDIGSRYPYMFVIVGAELYWFLSDLATLQPVKQTLLQLAAEVPLADSEDYFVSDNLEGALAEIGAKLATRKNPFTISLPAGASVADRLAGATIPSGWAIESSGGTNLLITHTQTGRNAVMVKVFEVDGTKIIACEPFGDAFSGYYSDGNTIMVEGLNTSPVPLEIYIIFS